MEGKYPLLIDGRESGELRVTRRGALTLFEGEGRVALRRQLSRAALRDFPEQIEYAAPAGAAPAVTEPEPGPEPESAPEPEPGPDEGPEGGLIWYSSPDGTLSAHDGRRLLVALPADDARVPAWAGDVVRSINGRKYVVFPW